MQTGISHTVVQISSGLIFSLIGLSIYLLIRGDTIAFIPDGLVVRGLVPDSITQLTNQLPTFTHLLAFALLTAGIVGAGRRTAALVCLFWLLVETAFEAAQHPIVSSWLVPHVPQWSEHILLLDNTRNFLLNGTFDPLDLVAAGIAALCAYVIIAMTRSQHVFFKDNEAKNISMEMKRSSS